MDCWWIID